MGIWIRSQNKELLVSADHVYYNHLFLTNVENHYVNYNGKILGRYSTKEKALKVLDMIQNEIRKPYKTCSKSENFIGVINQTIENYSDKVLQMPQDDEVEV